MRSQKEEELVLDRTVVECLVFGVCLRKVRRGGFEKELEDGSVLQSEGRARRQRCRDSGQ